MTQPSSDWGGPWTQDKLSRVQKYLARYTLALKNQPFTKYYIDAFAGTGYQTLTKGEQSKDLLFPELLETEPQQFLAGSARIALETEPRFDKYVFVEKKGANFRELQKLRQEYPHLRHDITLYQGEANHYLQEKICKNLKHNKLHRAVVFLDPYGMEVEWATIEALAETQVVDLWLLFPLDVAVNRFLRRDAEIAPADRARLTKLFGTNDWFEAFYQKPAQLSFFEDEERLEKVGNFDTISEYFVKRLQSVFGSDGVAKNPLRLYNSTGVPIYLLCFAASNPKGKSIALNIAEHILSR